MKHNSVAEELEFLRSYFAEQQREATEMHRSAMQTCDRAVELEKSGESEKSKAAFMSAALRECFASLLAGPGQMRGITLMSAYNIYVSIGAHELADHCRKKILNEDVPDWVKAEVSLRGKS